MVCGQHVSGEIRIEQCDLICSFDPRLYLRGRERHKLRDYRVWRRLANDSVNAVNQASGMQMRKLRRNG